MIFKNLTKLLFVIFVVNVFFIRSGLAEMEKGLSLNFERIEDMTIQQLVGFESKITELLFERQKSHKLSEISDDKLIQLLNNLKISEFAITNELFTRRILISDVSFKVVSLPEQLKSPFSELEESIRCNEIEFLDGSTKSLDFLQKGYDKFKSLGILGDKLEEFDNNLQSLYLLSSHQNICRQLAESYKDLAESTQNKDHYFKAAFWFRLLYSVGAHSTYLGEYRTMILKAKEGTL